MNDFTSPVGIEWGPGKSYGIVQYQRPDELSVIFYQESQENSAKSREAGRRICENVVMIRIQHPGERLNIITRPADDNDKRRWPHQWNSFVHNQVQIPEGTPIDLLFPNNPAVADMLKSAAVYTIDQLANLSGNGLDSIGMGAQEYKNKAKAYLDSASKGQAFHQLQKQVEDLQSENRVVKQQLDLALSQLKAFEQRMLHPQMASNQPPFVPGYDVQAERLNASHPSKEAVEASGRTRNKQKNEDK